MKRIIFIGVILMAIGVKISEAQTSPNDPYFPNQWNLNQDNDHDIDMPEAWEIEIGSPEIIVAVMNSGIDCLHEDLIENIWVNPGEDLDGDGVVWDIDDLNGQDDDGNGYVDDLIGWDFADSDNTVSHPSFSHGTMVAGIIASSTNNSTGIAGIAGGWGGEGMRGIKLMPLKIVHDHLPTIQTNWVVNAILYAVEKGARILITSQSLEDIPIDTLAIMDAIEYAYNNNVFIIAAAGNYPLSHPYFPARARYVFAVGATDQQDMRWERSNYGDSLDITAPGVEIWSTTNDNHYGSSTGTSYAAPHVAGVAALLLSHNSF